MGAGARRGWRAWSPISGKRGGSRVGGRRALRTRSVRERGVSLSFPEGGKACRPVVALQREKQEVPSTSRKERARGPGLREKDELETTSYKEREGERKRSSHLLPHKKEKKDPEIVGRRRSARRGVRVYVKKGRRPFLLLYQYLAR